MKKLASLMGRSFLLVAVIYFVTVTTSALVFEFAEGKYDAVDSFWWAFTTATTTGYGDIYPVTKTGRAVALFLMHFGPGFAFPMMTAIMSAKLIVDSDAFTHGEQEQLKEDIAAIRGMMTPANEVGFAAAARLEADMRHYLHDEEPTRRAQCLDEFRHRLALAPWAETSHRSDGDNRQPNDRGDEDYPTRR
jgi:hypothetical protein